MRLLLAALLSLVLATPAAWAAETEDSYAREVAGFRLDMALVQHMTAAAADMKAYLQADPDEARKVQEDANAEQSLGQAIAGMEKQPAFAAILKKNGLTARQYVLGALALMQAGMGAWAVQKGGPDTWDRLKAKGVNTDNVHFYMDHKAELDKLTAAMPPDAGG